MWENSTDYGFFCDIECPEYNDRYIYTTVPFSFSSKKKLPKIIYISPAILPKSNDVNKYADHKNTNADEDAYEDDIEFETSIPTICLCLATIGFAAYCLLYE